MTAPRRVLVTGGSGFIGRSLVPALVASGHEVVQVTRDDSRMGVTHVVDLIVDTRPDVVVHLATRFLAGHDVGDIPDLVRTNVEFGTAVAEGATRAGSRLVSLGSAWQHYEGRGYDAVSLYAATKQALSVIVDYFAAARGLEACEVVLFDTYGPGDVRPKLIPSLLRAALTGVPLDMSDGGQLIDLTYVDDVVRGIAGVALAHDPPRSCVLRTWEPVSIRGLVSVMEGAVGRPVPVRWGVRPARDREMRGDWVFGGSPDGWVPEVPLGDGLRRTWDELAAKGGTA